MKTPSGMDRKIASERTPIGPFVRIYFKGEFVRNYRLEIGVFVVGREPTCDICIPGRFVSRKHFQIEYEEAYRIYVQDLGSSNGILVNGLKVDRAPLAHGDHVQIGDLEFKFSVPAPAQSKVIPFPRIKTDPKIDVTKIQAASLPTVLPPRRPTPIQTVATYTVSVALAAVVAVSLHSWVTHRTLPFSGWLMRSVEIQKPTVSIGPTAVPTTLPEVISQIEMTPTGGSPPPQVEEVAEEIHEPEVALNPSVKIEQKSKKPPLEFHPSQDEKNQITASLDRSLKGLDKKGELGRADQIVTNDETRTEATLRPFKAFKNQPTSIDVEIQMPKLDDILKKKLENEKAVIKKFDPQEYQGMLRSRISGVEGCYYQHVKSGSTGKVSVWFAIARDGTVKSSGIAESTIPNAALQTCIVQRISKLKLDPPPFDGFTVTYGFRFGVQKVKF